MYPNTPSSNTYDALHESENIPDPLDEFLSKLLSGIPDPLPIPTPTNASASAPAPTSSDITCHWVSPHHPPFICGTSLPSDPKDVITHFRLVHNVRGNDKVTADCHWHACRAAPMQRGSVIRHILAVHLGLLRWQCEVCGRVFSRKGTVHVSGGGESA